MSLPFLDSRRLTGANLYFSAPGAVLETAPGILVDNDTVARWRARVEVARIALGWPAAPAVARIQKDSSEFALAAPIDQLFTATEVNEWAFQHAVANGSNFSTDEIFLAPAYPALWDDDDALQTLRLAAAAEHRPDLMALLDAARDRHLPALLDDEQLTLGEGRGAQTWPLDDLPDVAAVQWSALHSVPVALVTGSNGKTTTTRLVAAICAAHGLRAALSCTDGVFVGSHSIASGDYSGPAGARAALRDARTQAAILETARGGILRRGLAVERAQAAIVSNVSADHFGEYGIRDLAGLADAKLVVARALDATGTLVLNADDAMLVQRAAHLSCRITWFALDADQPLLVAHRARGGATCGVRDGALVLHDGSDRPLGKIVNMPLTMHGAAAYNIANIAGSALLANALQIPPTIIADVLARFGRDNADNPGRLMRWLFGATHVLLDYAHNPEGLRGLLDVANDLRGARMVDAHGQHVPGAEDETSPPFTTASSQGRLALVLGQAGNREEDDIRKLAASAAEFRPELIVLKDIESFLRGRQSGEIAAILKAELLQKSIPDTAITICLDEVEAARTVLRWARDGDVLVLPIHDKKARTDVAALLDRLAAVAWKPGLPLSIT